MNINMPSSQTDSVSGHQSRYDHLNAHLPAAEVGPVFVGGGEPIWMGYIEAEVIRSYASLSGASIVDVGCGIGRLARHLMLADIESYLGIDVVAPILEQAIAIAGSDGRFRFEIASECKIPYGGSSIVNQRTPSPLLDVSQTPDFLPFPQSLCIMRV
jgi:SAM-dependent methyltransferase